MREESFELRLTIHFRKGEVRFHDNLRNPCKKDDNNKMMKNTFNGRSKHRHVGIHDETRKESDRRGP